MTVDGDAPAAGGTDYGRVVLLPSGAELRRRLPRLVFGLGIIAVGISLMVRSELGLAPYDVLHQGISRVSFLTIGQAQVVIGVVVLAAWWPLHQRPGIGTVTNALGVGFAIDGVLALVDEPTQLWLRVAYLLTGIALTGIGIGLYIGSRLGPGPRDGLMTAFADRGMRVWKVRLVLEATALAIGWALGGTVGIGTVLFAVAIPYLSDLSLRWFTLD